MAEHPVRCDLSALCTLVVLLVGVLLSAPLSASADSSAAITVHVRNVFDVAMGGSKVYVGPPGTSISTCTLQSKCGVGIGTADGNGNLAYVLPQPTATMVFCAEAPQVSLGWSIGCTGPLTPTPGATVTITVLAVPATPSAGAQGGSGMITLVLQDDTGQPLANAPVVLVQGSTSISYGTAPDGTLTFANVSNIDTACGYVFSTQSGQFTQSGCTGPTSVPSRGATTATIRLSPGAGAVAQMQRGAVVITAHDPNGDPVPNVFISVAVNPDINTHYQSDAQGRYMFVWPAGVPTFPIYFSPSTPLGGAEVAPFTVQPGEVKQISLTLPMFPTPPPSPQPSSTTGSINGTVYLSGARAPVSGATVRVDGTSLSSGPLKGGTFQFPAVSTTGGTDGGPTYTVSLVPPAGYAVVGPVRQQVTVQAGHGVEVDFAVQRDACSFVLGFQTFHAALPAVIGDCLENERHNPVNGDALQQTTHGLLVWRKADNFTAFTDGYRTWVNGPNGVQERLNSQRFSWETNPNGLPAAP